MGVYWNGIKTQFSEIDHLRHRLKEPDFDYSEVLEHPASTEIDFTIKTPQLVRYSAPIEYGIKYLPDAERMFYSTFFFHTFWTTFDDEDQAYIDLNRYTNSFSNDDLGWLELNSNLYWKSFNYETLQRIVDNYEKVDFSLIREIYELERTESQKQLESHADFCPSGYQQEINETFENFMELTRKIIELYKSCTLQKKDIIVELA